MKFFSLIQKILSLTLHLASIVALAFVTTPIAKWYLSRIPALGVDLYYTATYVAYHLRNFSLPFNSFKDVWFAGYPLFQDIFQLHFYAIIPFAQKLGLIEGIQIYVIVTLFLLTLFSYLLFYRLSKNHVLSAVLAFLILFSVNIYGAAIWGGSLPYFATQMFFPLILFLVSSYKLSGNRGWFYMAILSAGIGALGHPQPVISFALPAVLLLLISWQRPEFKESIFKRIKDSILFGFLTILISLRIFYPFLLTWLKSILGGNIFGVIGYVYPGSTGGAQTNSDIANFYKSLAKNLFTDSHIWLFYLAGAFVIVFIISLVIFKERLQRFANVIPFLLVLLFVTAHVYLNAYGFTFLSQGWYRTFWAFPVALGAFIASTWGQSIRALTNAKKIGFVFNLGFSAIFLVLGLLIYQNTSLSLFFQRMEAKSELSSTFPEILSIKTSKEELKEIKKNVVPSFIDPNDKNKRLYTADATVNIWWNALFPMPLARGYIDAPIANSERGGFFWLDIAIANDSLVKDFGVDEDTAYNNTLFLIDWYAVHFFEGGRLGSKGPSPGPSTYLINNNVFDKEEEVINYGAILKYQTASGKPEVHLDIPQSLKYFKVKDEFTSPVLMPTNSPAVIVFTTRGGYEDILRMLAAFNINSKKLIPVYGGRNVDAVSFDELKKFDAVFMSDYDYKNESKTYLTLQRFVENGGKVFIDTGAETKDSDKKNLSEIFPFSSSAREKLGREFDLSDEGEPGLFAGVDRNSFGPLIYDNDDWKLTTPSSIELREGSKVVIKHKGKPILIERKLGKGEIVWSGMNLAYHYNQYKSRDEARLFRNIVDKFVEIDEDKILPAKAKWIRPEWVQIAGEGKPRGILLKEEGYKGWSVNLVSPSRNKLPIYQVGPTFPGFIYVPLSNLTDGGYKVEFKYLGAPKHWLITFTSLVTILVLLELSLFKGRIWGERLSKITLGTRTKVGSWWEKEEG